MPHQKTVKHILESMPEGIVGHDRDRRITYLNRAAEKITGWSRDEVMGKDCHEVFGTPFCGQHCSFFEGTSDFRVKQNYPLNIVTKQGKPKQISMSVSSLFDEKGKIIGHVGIFQDITSLVGLRVWEGSDGFPGIVGQDSKLINIFNKIREISLFDYPVLLQGETGTGKELVAHAIHSESKRASCPFLAVNCGALPEALAESELFGHVKGAFSGAVRDKKGRFELANTGTLFLDEVAELPKAIQVKLLRVIENGTFERVGGEKTCTVDVRIISATNRDLKREVEKNHFREDLFYRLNVVPIDLPPLRERKNDIPLLIDYFLRQAEEHGQKVARFSEKALALLLSYDWPGNVRELRSVIQYALVARKTGLIGPESLPPEFRMCKTQPQPGQKLDQETVQAALAQSGGNKVKAAKLLGIGRATLYRFLQSVS